MTLTIIGHGYVGLVTAAVFSDLGNKIWVVGRTREKIDALTRGNMPFFEPGLEEVVRRNIAAGRLIFTLDYTQAIPESEIILICVGTPAQTDGRADLSSVFEVSRQIGSHINSYKLIVVKSTVPPGTNKRVRKRIMESVKEKISFDTASCPEFLREGSAMGDTLAPDRIVLGVDTDRAKRLLVDLHKPIGGKVVVTSIETAEMIKYVANALLSTKISFANAIAFLCDEVGADVEKVMDGVGLDKRIGRGFLSPGVGYGGSCFPKDIKALIAFSSSLGYDFKLLKDVDDINRQAVEHYLDKVKKSLKNNIQGKVLGVLGLAFKPNTDDMREAPSVKIIKKLQDEGAIVQAYDPQAHKNASSIIKNITFCSDAYEAADNADALLVITEWNEFRQLDLNKIKKRMKKPLVIDGRNIYDPEKMRKMGFTYHSIGRS